MTNNKNRPTDSVVENPQLLTTETVGNFQIFTLKIPPRIPHSSDP